MVHYIAISFTSILHAVHSKKLDLSWVTDMYLGCDPRHIYVERGFVPVEVAELGHLMAFTTRDGHLADAGVVSRRAMEAWTQVREKVEELDKARRVHWRCSELGENYVDLRDRLLGSPRVADVWLDEWESEREIREERRRYCRLS